MKEGRKKERRLEDEGRNERRLDEGRREGVKKEIIR